MDICDIICRETDHQATWSAFPVCFWVQMCKLMVKNSQNNQFEFVSTKYGCPLTRISKGKALEKEA